MFCILSDVQVYSFLTVNLFHSQYWSVEKMCFILLYCDQFFSTRQQSQTKILFGKIKIIMRSFCWQNNTFEEFLVKIVWMSNSTKFAKHVIFFTNNSHFHPGWFFFRPKSEKLTACGHQTGNLRIARRVCLH